VGVAVKVTVVPMQMVVAEAEMETVGVTDEVTVIVMVLDVIEEGTAHVAELVRMHVT
jgi:hypothetical protein